MRKAVSISVVWLMLGAVAVATPRLTLDREVYDFGTAMDGDVIQFNVVLTNTGSATLQISNVSYNCACTSYTFPNNARTATLGPGQSVVMTVTFRTAGYSRYSQPVFQELTIHSNDSVKPQQTVRVQGTVRQLAAYEGAASTLEAEFYVLVDLRPAEEYARGTLLGAVNIPFAELEKRLGQLPKNKVIYVYDATGIQAVQGAQLLQQNAFLIPRALSGGLVEWWRLYGDLFFVWAPGAVRTTPIGAPFYGTFSVIAASQLAQRYLYVVDIRSPKAYAEGRFPGSVRVSLGTQEEIVAWAAALPRPRSGAALFIWVVDEDGTRACTVVQYLQSVGFTSARCLFGGIAAWRAQFGDQLLFPQP